METLEPSDPALAPGRATTDVLAPIALVEEDSSPNHERPAPSKDARPASSDPAPGSIAASLVACGIACMVFGFTVVLAAASPDAKKALEFYEPAGSLSGKGIVATGAWLVSWAVLHVRLRNRDLELRPYIRASFALIGLGFLGTFPPFFELFAPH